MFLGHLVSKAQVRMDTKKVQAIVKRLAPTKVPGLRSFLDLANYYHKFIAGYSKKVVPLADLLKKGQRWEWIEAYAMAFNKLKEAIALEPALSLPNFQLPFEVHTDASEKAIGGVLV
ncbi:hypothetical protein Patl1_35022 [Pistacia atlantica]|uniref:Uncharacterized protein n=1 Tax=Pistacia atlantica TaxID=434234 RepID=A0ACC0ZXK2_9ROSI|nr:hypothetical protein Patl1_35022 [Pistacia atlantica]